MIKLVCFDYDGVFTDSNIYIMDDIALKQYNCKDGCGISLLKKNNIKTGIISSHKLETNIKSLIKHLNIDYYNQGTDNKLNVLKEWIKKENINLNEVAYIGDDISDIEILSQVGFSGCPFDAIDEVKKIVDYKCNKKGGEACVREFIDHILSKHLTDNLSNFNKQIKNEALYQLENFKNINFNFITNKILECLGNIYITGVGKSENFSKHLVDLLKSINIKSFYFNIMNSTHGDLGCIDKNDIIIFFSKSGNTSEIIDKIDLFKCFKIGICCNKNSLFEEHCDYNLVLPFQSELKNNKNIDCIPSNSYMSNLIFGNILINNLIEKSNLTINTYKSNHPSGNIGYNLKKIKDIIIKDYPKIILDENDTNKIIKLNNILLEMTKYSIGCCFFVNEKNNLLGVLTDGDIRRSIVINRMNDIDIENINKNYISIENSNLFLKEIINKDNYKKAKFIPVIENNYIIGIIDYRNI